MANQGGGPAARLRGGAEFVAIPLLAVALAMVLFSGFLLILGKSPIDFFDLAWRGGFGSAFSLQNTLLRASPLILAALCVAIPARIGLTIIGGEGALVLGGFAAAAIALPIAGRLPPAIVMPVMAVAAVACLPGCGAPKYPAVLAADYLRARLDATYAHNTGAAA